MSNNESTLELVSQLRELAHKNNKPSQLLRFLVLEQKIDDQILHMELFRDAFNCSLGSVTAIGAWWHEGEHELDDEAIDSYIGYVLTDYLQQH